MEIFKQFSFDSAHFLPFVPDGHKCKEIHGHTYRAVIYINGKLEREIGWVMDFAELKRIVSERIVTKCDCRNLNSDVEFLEGVIPTAENLAVRFWEELAPHVAPARLVKVVLHETERNKVVYEGRA